MIKFRKILAASLVVALMAAVPALLPGADVQAASSNDGDSGDSADKTRDFDRGQQSFRNGDWQEAVAYFKKAVADDAKNAEAYNLMGYSYRRMGEADPAFDAYAKALDLEPDHRGANEYLGATYLLVGDAEMAQAQLAKLKDLCGNQCKETVKLRKAIERYEASADKQVLLDLDSENW
jgi:Flp pilus assembly protein TadD